MFYPAFLSLGNQIIYKGWSLFDKFISDGEIVFNTGMTGYQEIMTDPSYFGQIIIFTYPELGNTGLNTLDNESDTIYTNGIIAKNICFYPSNWRSKISLKDYIIEKRIPHIFGIDTRSLACYIRSHGVTEAYISSNMSYLKTDSNSMISSSKILDLVKKVTIANASVISVNRYFDTDIYSHLNYKISKLSEFELRIIVIDFGIKLNILSRLNLYNCKIILVPAWCSYETIVSYKPDGILLSNGPGDPSLVTYGIDLVKKLIRFANIPIFGICMGHQILSLALGAKIFKLKFGHRGLNHPIGKKQRSEITSQNHGFAVEYNMLNSKVFNNTVELSHVNLNDDTIAGIFHKDKPIFSVQYHPEASPGPHDSEYLFKIFLQISKKIKLGSNISKTQIN